MKNHIQTMLAGILCGMLCLSLCACGNNSGAAASASDADRAADMETQENRTEGSGSEEAAEEIPSDSADDEQADESKDADECAEASAEFQIPVQDDFAPAVGLSDKYADLENRSFAYNEKVFTLGKSTLEDLIDGGIPFDTDDLNNRGNNVNSNYESNEYTVDINDYVSMQFRFVNVTEGTLTEEECLLSYVRYSYLYVPQPDYDEDMNVKITESILDASKTVCFSFPATLTREQLLENCSEGAEESGNNVNYAIDSEIYMGSSGYNFTFNKNTNQMERMSMTWLP